MGEFLILDKNMVEKPSWQKHDMALIDKKSQFGTAKKHNLLLIPPGAKAKYKGPLIKCYHV